MILFLTILSLVYMVGAVIQIVCSFARTDRQGRCQLLKNYKKGKFAVIFVAVFPLYIAAYLNAGQSLLRILINSVNSTLSLVALSFDLDVLEPLAEGLFLFRVAIALCMILSVINAILFSVSLFFRTVFNRKMLRQIRRQKRDVCVLVGFEEKGDHILSSLLTSKREIDVLVLSFNITNEFKEKMYVSRAAYLPFSSSDDLSSVLTKACGGFEKRHCSVILLADSEEENLKLAFCAARLANSLGESLCLAGDKGRGLDTYLFSENDQETIYRRIVRMSFGTVHCMNRYQMLATDFTQRYPITQFIPHLIDTQHAALKEGADIRISMVGFGKVNRQLFRVFTQNNQCMVMEKDTPREKPLSYCIFDKSRSYDESSFNHTYLHYRRWKEEVGDSDDYFEFPEEPATVRFEEIDINRREFFMKLQNALTTEEKGFNLIIIALGTDIEALDLAEKVAMNVCEIGCEKQTRIFVRVRNRALMNEFLCMEDKESPIIPFGDDLSLFTYDRIVNPDIDGMAKDRHLCYSLEDCQPNQTEEEARLHAFRKWFFEWDTIQRESNIYAVLSIRMRLQLLGYDCVPVSDPAPDATREYLADYSRGNPIEYNGRELNGKKLVNYKTEYRRAATPRSVLAETEHSRWNAYYIGNGFVPASKSELKKLGKAELTRRRKHINLTTFRGLDLYDAWRTAPNTPPENRPDIIFYDYQLMDDAAWILSRNGYKIIRRK